MDLNAKYTVLTWHPGEQDGAGGGVKVHACVNTARHPHTRKSHKSLSIAATYRLPHANVSNTTGDSLISNSI